MKKNLKSKVAVQIFIVFVFILAVTAIAPLISQAQTTNNVPASYTLLAPIPLGNSGTPVSSVTVGCDANGKNCGIQQYVVDVLNLIYGMATVLAIIVIIIGGIQYMSTDAISGKQDGKKRINDALWGLLIVICSYIILYTINPNLVSLNLLNDINQAPPAQTASTATTPSNANNAVCYSLTIESSSGFESTITYSSRDNCTNAIDNKAPGSTVVFACITETDQPKM